MVGSGCPSWGLHDKNFLSECKAPAVYVAPASPLCWCLKTALQNIISTVEISIFVPNFGKVSSLCLQWSHASPREGKGAGGGWGPFLKLAPVSWIAIIYSLKLHLVPVSHHFLAIRVSNMWWICQTRAYIALVELVVKWVVKSYFDKS